MDPSLIPPRFLNIYIRINSSLKTVIFKIDYQVHRLMVSLLTVTIRGGSTEPQDPKMDFLSMIPTTDHEKDPQDSP